MACVDIKPLAWPYPNVQARQSDPGLG